MALTETISIPLGFQAPWFRLPDVVTGDTVSLDELKGLNGTVVMFICNHCPYVIHIRGKLVAMAREYMKKGIAFIAISSNDVERYPDDAPEKMKQIAEEMAFPFPYLYDESQAVAKAYHAACTPDFDVFDAAMKCVYRGRFDESTPGNGKPLTGTDLRDCLDALLRGRPPVEPQYPSMGCNIKWKTA